MRYLASMVLAAFFCLASVRAQDSTAPRPSALDSTVNAKVDSILKYQKRMSEQQDSIYNEVVATKEPLANKTFGIELNPAYLVIGMANDHTNFSAGFSLFNVDRRAEIAFPVWYLDEDGSSTLNVDVHYRRFLGRHQDGFYISGGLRLTYQRGSHYSYPYAWEKTSSTRFGPAFGIGYRYFSASGFYWGMSLFVGAYLNGEQDHTYGLFSGKTIVDMELLKIGYAF